MSLALTEVTALWPTEIWLVCGWSEADDQVPVNDAGLNSEAKLPSRKLCMLEPLIESAEGEVCANPKAAEKASSTACLLGEFGEAA